MKSSENYKPNYASAILCVGDPGSGKSRLGMAFPSPGILDCDNNLSSAIRVSNGKKFLYAQPFVDDAGKEVPDVERWSRAVKETKELLTSPLVDTFILDGLSALCRWGLAHAENECVKAGINVKKEFFAKYNAFIPLLSGYLTMIRIPGKRVVVNVHQRMEKDELSGSIRYKLDIPGQLADNLGGQFSDIWGTSSIANPSDTVIGAKYFIRTKPSGYHVNLKTSLDLEPSVDITGKTPEQIWTLLSPKLSVPTLVTK